MNDDQISTDAYLTRVQALRKEYDRKVGAVTRRKRALQAADLPSKEKGRRWLRLMRGGLEAGEEVTARLLALPAPPGAEDAVEAYRAALVEERAQMWAILNSIERGQSLRARRGRRKVLQADERRKALLEDLESRLAELN